MPYGLYLSADGAHAQALRLEVIANNLANVDTVGFKRDLAILQARYAEEIAQGLDEPGTGSLNDVGGGTMVCQTRTDFSAGPLKRTGIPTDVAIDGDGFFVVRKGDQNYLTRAGNFRLTDRGELVTQQGYPVLSDNGAPVVIDMAAGAFQITPDGVVRQPGAAVALALVRPAPHDELAKVGENLFRPQAEPQPLPAGQRRVAAGYLELSGVRPTSEMVQLIEASRAIEANLQLMQAQDQMLSGLVNRLLRV